MNINKLYSFYLIFKQFKKNIIKKSIKCRYLYGWKCIMIFLEILFLLKLKEIDYILINLN